MLILPEIQRNQPFFTQFSNEKDVLNVLVKSLFNNTQGRTRSFHFDKLVNLSKWHFRETLFVRLKHSKTFEIATK